LLARAGQPSGTATTLIQAAGFSDIDLCLIHLPRGHRSGDAHLLAIQNQAHARPERNSARLAMAASRAMRLPTIGGIITVHGRGTFVTPHERGTTQTRDVRGTDLQHARDPGAVVR
jgi:hypothetical protein